jgi:hypothetical protein
VEIASIDPILPEYDQHVFLQNLTLQGGTLNVSLIGLNENDPPYQPSFGDMFQIIEVHGVWTGQFGTLNLPQLTGGLQWNTSHLYSSGMLSVVPEPSAGLLALVALIGLSLSSRHRQ